MEVVGFITSRLQSKFRILNIVSASTARPKPTGEKLYENCEIIDNDLVVIYLKSANNDNAERRAEWGEEIKENATHEATKNEIMSRRFARALLILACTQLHHEKYINK